METGRHGSEKRRTKSSPPNSKKSLLYRETIMLEALKLGMIPVSPKSAVAPSDYWELDLNLFPSQQKVCGTPFRRVQLVIDQETT
jgi:hypothetical protein